MRKATKTVATWMGVVAGLGLLLIVTMLPLSMYVGYAQDAMQSAQGL